MAEAEKVEDDVHEKFTGFLEAIAPKQADQFAQLTDDEFRALTLLRDEMDAIDTTLHSAMDKHTQKAGEIRKATRIFWNGIEARLKEQWPKTGKVRAEGRLLYR